MDNTLLFVILCCALNSVFSFKTDDEFRNFLQTYYEKNATELCTKKVTAEYDFYTDLHNKQKEETMLQLALETGDISKYFWKNYFKDLNPDSFQSEDLKRQAQSLKVIDADALDTEKLTQFTTITSNMSNIYSVAKICPYKKQECDLDKEGLSLEPDLTDIMSSSVDYDELKYVWKAWRDASGAKIKSQYQTYVELSNEAAKANGFPDNSKMWQYSFETPNFEEDMETLWMQVKPLYVQLHKYVSNKLKKRYGDKIDLSDNLIPAHVLGNMWGQSWEHLYDLVKPFPEASNYDVTKALVEKNYTVQKMFETANEFYLSLGLEDCSISYNTKAGAVILKPTDRDIVCHASAWDFCDGKDFKIKMCTSINGEDFVTVHHEMGHIEYYLLYKNQPHTFRNGANPGFHEAVGDTIALSVGTPNHLKKIGLLEDYKESKEAELNALMKIALEKIAFLPFGYLIDKWRWDVFSGKVEPKNYNSHWWKYRENIQMLKAPVERSENDFDPGAKYHVAGDSQYISYFIAHILQFQLYQSLCKVSGQFVANDKSKPLYNCDFYNSKEAGQKLRDGLSLGSSKHWSEALKAMTGETNLKASAIMEYFSPLYNYLVEQNALPESEIDTILNKQYNKHMSSAKHKSSLATWDTEVFLGDPEKEEADLKATLNVANIDKMYWLKYFQYLEPKFYKNETIQRELKKLTKLGDAVLEDDDLTKLSNCTMQMTTLYGQAKVCPYKNQNCDLSKEGWSLEPEIEAALANSTDDKELEYLWVAWRNATGAKMRETYKTYVTLSNKAARLNYYNDRGEMWREEFESPTFIEDMDKLWKQVEPLYLTLHKYAIKKLKTRYPHLDFSDGLIPAHITGNMWAQTWTTLSDLLKPFPDAAKVDVTNELVSQGYTPLKMFQAANDFYQSLGLEPCEMSYNTTAGAIIEKPDKDIVCHASAWDFFDGKDFRIKMCTKVNGDDFVTIHHEMGHIQYYILYKDQPVVFKDGANPGFHEAVGDTIALSVSSVKHLRRIGLLNDYVHTKKSDINALMDIALEKVVFLPFGLLIDKWRWDVFRNNTDATPHKWNEHWWHYRETIQRVKSPVKRSSTDFDPGAKFHVANGDYYISYFVSYILQFQLYRGLCKEAGEYDPGNKSKSLHNCDYYKSIEAGNKLRAGLSLGSSKHWKDVLQAITGETDYDASAILEYFQPLKEALDGMLDYEEESNTLPIALGLTDDLLCNNATGKCENHVENKQQIVRT